MIKSFLSRLASFGDSDAIIFQGKTYSYAELLHLGNDWRNYLDRMDIRPGTITTLEGDYSPQTCIGLLTLIARGAIVVPLCPLPAAKRAELLGIGQVEATIEVTGDSRHCQRTERTAEHELYRKLRSSKTPGLVLHFWPQQSVGA